MANNNPISQTSFTSILNLPPPQTTFTPPHLNTPLTISLTPSNHPLSPTPQTLINYLKLTFYNTPYTNLIHIPPSPSFKNHTISITLPTPTSQQLQSYYFLPTPPHTSKSHFYHNH